MKHGIGIRYSEQGIRLLKLVYSDKGMKISGVAAGPPAETSSSFFDSEEMTPENTTVAIGLGPGKFLSSYVFREEGMTDEDMKSHLQWEINHKIISEPEEYAFDFFITDLIGCIFAGRNELIESEKSSLGDMGVSGMKTLTDVESVALYNGSEGAGEIGMETAMIVSLEAEGISSLVMDNGTLNALESFVIDEESLLAVLPGLDSDGMNNAGAEAAERMAGYITGSMSRLTSFGDYEEKPTLKQIVLSGGGVYIGEGNIAEIVSEKTDIKTVVSNPLKPLMTEVPENQAELIKMSAAFTTCFGLALRALEE